MGPVSVAVNASCLQCPTIVSFTISNNCRLHFHYNLFLLYNNASHNVIPTPTNTNNSAEKSSASHPRLPRPTNHFRSAPTKYHSSTTASAAQHLHPITPTITIKPTKQWQTRTPSHRRPTILPLLRTARQSNRRTGRHPHLRRANTRPHALTSPPASIDEAHVRPRSRPLQVLQRGPIETPHTAHSHDAHLDRRSQCTWLVDCGHGARGSDGVYGGCGNGDRDAL